jgi:ABC-type lipoprotein release transport system permease subunit
VQRCYCPIPKERSAFLHHRNAAIAGRKLASRYGWKIGDVIPLRGTSYPGNWNFVLQGIYHGAGNATDETTFFFHWDTLNENLKKTAPSRADQVGAYIVGIENVDKAAEISREKALGFGPGYIFVLIFGESLILSLSAGIAGILLSYPAADLLRSELDTIFPVFNVAEKNRVDGAGHSTTRRPFGLHNPHLACRDHASR